VTAGGPTGGCVDPGRDDAQGEEPGAQLGACATLIRPGDHAVGRSLADMGVRQRTGALVVAIRRGEELSQAPDAARPIQAGDMITLAGSLESIQRARSMFENGGQG
jgi:K+/H+ antiporter YhaU regulatory subunit KhtT